MSSLMMPRAGAGAGAVTVEGLTPEVLLAGHKVTVSQRNKIITDVNGELDLLFMAGGIAENNSDPGSRLHYWNGTQYVTARITWGATVNFVGTPKYAAAYVNGNWPGNTIGGNNFGNTLKFFTEFLNNTFTTQNQIGMQLFVVVLGVK